MFFHGLQYTETEGNDGGLSMRKLLSQLFRRENGSPPCSNSTTGGLAGRSCFSGSGSENVNIPRANLIVLNDNLHLESKI